MGVMYKLLDGISRAYNKLLLLPALRRSFAACGENVTLGRRSEVAGAGNSTWAMTCIWDLAQLCSPHAQR